MLGSKRCLESCESVKGRILWTKFFQLMQFDVLPALPVQCKHHPETKQVLKNEKNIDRAADGGRDLRCSVMVECGHRFLINATRWTIPAYCLLQHKLNCLQGHILDYLCGNGPRPCKMCAEYESTLHQPEQ